MGIPGLFQYIRQTFKGVSTTKSPIGCDRLLIDGNCQLYKMNKTGFVSTNNDSLFPDVSSHFSSVISKFGTSKVFIALDGIPPHAKIEEQKKRRILRRQTDREFTDKYAPIISRLNMNFTDCNFTLGTELMNSVNESLKNFCKANSYGFSGITINGEGEQKVFKSIRQNTSFRSCVIDSADCDIIIIGLLYLLDFPDKELYFHIVINGVSQYIKLHELYTQLGTDVLLFVSVVMLFGSDFFTGIESQCLSREIIDTVMESGKGAVLQPIKRDVITRHLFINVPEFIKLLKIIEPITKSRSELGPKYLFYDEDEFVLNDSILHDPDSPDSDLLLVLENQYTLLKTKKSPIDICLNHDCVLCKDIGDINNGVDKATSYIKMYIWTLNYFAGDVLNYSLVYGYNTGPAIDKVLYVLYSTKQNGLKLIKESDSCPMGFTTYSKIINDMDTTLVEAPYCNRHPIKSKYQSVITPLCI